MLSHLDFPFLFTDAASLSLKLTSLVTEIIWLGPFLTPSLVLFMTMDSLLTTTASQSLTITVGCYATS